jgi:hypothetical protein
MEFIFKNVENPNITKDIIYINKEMLYRLNNNKYDASKFIGGNFEHTKELKKFKESTISIIESLENPIKKQQEIIKKADIALRELIKYIDMLYDYVKREDLEKISVQLKELKEKINQY